MKTAIDAAGRIVIPKALRDRLGLARGRAVEIRERDGRIERARPVYDWIGVRYEIVT